MLTLVSSGNETMWWWAKSRAWVTLGAKFIDVTFFGYCATIHFEELRSKLIEDGEIDEKEIDSTFFAIIGLKVKS